MFLMSFSFHDAQAVCPTNRNDDVRKGRFFLHHLFARGAIMQVKC